MSNKYLSELIRLAESRFSVETEGMTYGEWMCKNTTLNSKPFSFKKYPFQEQIANDWHANLSVIKPSQIGLTEVQVRKALAFLFRNQGITMLMTFPSDDMRKRNSQTRIQPILEDPVFDKANTSNDKPIKSVSLIQIGKSFLHITGSKEDDATSTSADVLLSDEIDLNDPTVLALFTSRLQGSDWKINQKYSTPSYSGFGIDQEFNNSDQHHYMIKCDHCGHTQFPIFEPQFIHIPNLSHDINSLFDIDMAMIDDRKLDLVNSYVCCEKCRQPLELNRTDNREWVPFYKSRTLNRGYRVNPFSVSTLPVSYIVGRLITFKDKDNLRGFKNTVLGLPDDAGSARISIEDITACKRSETVPEVNKKNRHWIGIDVGQICNIAVGEGPDEDTMRVVLLTTCGIDNLASTVKTLNQTYNFTGGAIDRFPYTPNADDIRDLSGGVIVPVEYRGTAEVRLVTDPEGKITHAQMERTMLLDQVSKLIRLRILLIYGYGIYWSMLIEHLRNMVREETPETPATWRKLDNKDHFFHAIGFMLGAPKIKDLEILKSDADNRTVVSVAGIDLSGYNTNILGRKQKSESLWPL